MKKRLSFAVFVTALMVSCTKVHNCECTTTAEGSPTVVNTIPIEDTRSNAKAACEAMTNTVSVGGVSSGMTYRLK